MENLQIIIIAIITSGFILDRILDALNRSSWSPVLPEALREFYNEDKYKNAQEYFLANLRFSQLTSSVSFVLIILVMIFGGFGYLSDMVLSKVSDPISAALLFFFCLAFISEIISLPFSLYRIFNIEERFGFNKMSLKTFVLDKIKGGILGLVIGGCLLYMVLKLYLMTGSNFWWISWAILAIFMIFISAFYTSILLPVFNKLTPLEEGELRSAIEAYCRHVDFPFKNIMVMDGSKRSSKANAFFSGLGRYKKIVLYDTLIQQHTVEELVAVLAHEVGHYKLKHTRTGLLSGLAQTGLMLFIFSLLLGNPALSTALGAKVPAVHLEFLALALLYSPVSTITGLLMNYMSRKHEFEADHYAGTTFNAVALSEALKKLSIKNLSNLRPHPAYVFFHYSHPPLLKRLAALKK